MMTAAYASKKPYILSEAKIMKIIVNVTAKDVFKVMIYGQNRNKLSWLMFVIVSSMFSVLSVVGLWAMNFPLQETLIVLIDFLFFIVMCYSFSIIFTVISTLLNPKWRKGRLGEHTFEINESGIIESTDLNRTEIFWPSVNAVDSKYSGLFFKHSTTELFIVPKKSFANVAEYNEFSKKFFELWNANKNA